MQKNTVTIRSIKMTKGQLINCVIQTGEGYGLTWCNARALGLEYTGVMEGSEGVKNLLNL